MPARQPPGTDLPAAGTLLASLEPMRDLLARRLVQEHHEIAEQDLNAAILSSILQAVFLRTGEECGCAVPGTLALLRESDGIGKRMARACSDAGLPPAALAETGQGGSRPLPLIPDDALRHLIGTVASAEGPGSCPGLLPEDLAASLDRYLGERIGVAEGYRTRRVAASAVLYTGAVDLPPQTIVEAVVVRAAGSPSQELARNATDRIRILDPACGAGRFLLSAYRFLARRERADCPGERLRELMGRSVFGTDIDPGSVSAARFVLLLAFIRDHAARGGAPPVPEQIRQLAGCLQQTIRCGNALIAPDYFSGKQVHPFNAAERRRINPFDWEEAFPEILAAGGFDAITGSPPPYRPVPVRARDEYFQTHYDTYAPDAGLYSYFTEKGLRLLRPGGSLAFLLPGTFLRQEYARPLRRLLLSRQILEIADTGRSRPLQEGAARIYVVSIRNQPPDQPFVVSDRMSGTGGVPAGSAGPRRFRIDQRSLDDGGWSLEDTRAAGLIGRIRRIGTPLERYVMGEIHAVTIRPGAPLVIVDQETRDRLTRGAGWCRRFVVPLLQPSDIGRYAPGRPGQYVIDPETRRHPGRCRELSRHLAPVDEGRRSGPAPDQLPLPANPPPEEPPGDPAGVHASPKIIFASHPHTPAFTYDPRGSYALSAGVGAILRGDPYLAAILNSSLGRFLLRNLCPLTDRGYHLSRERLGRFPVVIPDFDRPADRNRHDRVVALVTRMVSLHDYLQKARTDQERRLVRQEIDATDVKIDALVYQLYGLTNEEIMVIERSTEP